MKTSILLFASLVFLALTLSVLISCDKKSFADIVWKEADADQRVIN